MAKHRRTDKNLLLTLKEHQNLLQDYHDKLFNEGKKEYIKPITSELRVLLHQKGNNKALLLELAKKHNIVLKVTIGGHVRKGVVLNFEDWLNEDSIVMRNTKDEMVHFSRIRLILLLSEQIGSCHEDWEIHEDLVLLLQSKIFISNIEPHIHSIGGITITTLSVIDSFFSHFNEDYSRKPY